MFTIVNPTYFNNDTQRNYFDTLSFSDKEDVSLVYSILVNDMASENSVMRMSF